MDQFEADNLGQFRSDKVDQFESDLLDHCNRILHPVTGTHVVFPNNALSYLSAGLSVYYH